MAADHLDEREPIRDPDGRVGGRRLCDDLAHALDRERRIIHRVHDRHGGRRCGADDEAHRRRRGKPRDLVAEVDPPVPARAEGSVAQLTDVGVQDAADRSCRDAIVEGGDEGRHEAATGGSGDAEAVRIHVGPCGEDVERRHRLDDHHAKRREARQQGRELSMLMPAVSAFPLPDRVEAEHHEPGACEADVEALDVGLEPRVLHPVARGVSHPRERPIAVRAVDVRGNDEPRYGLVQADLDRVPVPADRRAGVPHDMVGAGDPGDPETPGDALAHGVQHARRIAARSRQVRRGILELGGALEHVLGERAGARRRCQQLCEAPAHLPKPAERPRMK